MPIPTSQFVAPLSVSPLVTIRGTVSVRMLPPPPRPCVHLFEPTHVHTGYIRQVLPLWKSNGSCV